MGWCGDFGCTINAACDHRMIAGPRSCSCDTCGVVCGGKYAGCKEVWAVGPRPGPRVRPAFPGRANAGAGARTGEASMAELALPGPAIRLPAGDGIDRIQTSVEGLRQEMHNVLTMLSQQQAILAMLVEARRPPPPARPHPSDPGGDRG